MEKISEWLEWDIERHLLSRVEETSSTAGFDDRSTLRPCECRLDWRIGKLCLMCDNTRLRQCSASDERRVDPYALGVNATKGGWTAKSAEDESEAQRRSAAMALLDKELATLLYNEGLRQGKVAQLQGVERLADRMSHKPETLVRIHRGVLRLFASAPTLASTLPNGNAALYVLSVIVPGRIKPVLA